MSAVSRDYAYVVNNFDRSKPEPTISKERMEEIRKSIAPFLASNDREKDNKIHK